LAGRRALRPPGAQPGGDPHPRRGPRPRARRMRETIAAGAVPRGARHIPNPRRAPPRQPIFPARRPPPGVPLRPGVTGPLAHAQARQSGAAVITQPDIRWGRCDIKSTNLLGNVLAMQAAVEAGGVEALLYLPDGTLTEGTHTSFFGVLDGVLLTAPNSKAILPG